MVRRSDAASFMPGVWVFPGGVVEDDEDRRSPRRRVRRRASHRACAVRELQEEAGVELGAEAELHAWSRWITPEVVPCASTRASTSPSRRPTPPRSLTRPRWAPSTGSNPAGALERGASGEIELVFPTIKHLESLVPYDNAEEALAAAGERVVEPILPSVVGSREEHRILLPGDPDY